MNLLFISNGVISKKNDHYYMNKHSGSFLSQVLSLGYNVTCFQFNKEMLDNENLNNHALDSAIKVHSVKIIDSNILGKIRSYIDIILYAFQIISKYDFVYIFYPGYTPYLSIIICLFFKKKYGLYVRGEKGIDTIFGKYFISKAEFCLTVSELLKNNILNINMNVDVIAPMMELGKKDILSSKSREKQRKLKNLLFVGRIEKNKGIFELAEALEELHHKGFDVSCNIVGGGDQFEQIKNRLSKIPTVVLHGQITNKNKLKELYLESDILVFPSYQEGFPRVLYEAMMNRVLVITTMVGGIPAVMTDDVNCLKIDKQSSMSIYNTICKVIDEDFNSLALLDNATETVKSIFDGSRKTHKEQFVEQLSKVEGLLC